MSKQLMKKVEESVAGALAKAKSIDPEAEHESGEKAKKLFCENWPAAKVGLSAAATLVVNPWLKLIVSLHLMIGNALEKRICKG